MIKLDVAHYLTLALGITLGDVETILSIFCLLLSIVFGIVSLLIKFKHYNSDGKIDKAEYDDLMDELNNLKEKINDRK